MHRFVSPRRVRLTLLALTMAATPSAHPLIAQDLGFVSSIFSRVQRLSLFVQALDPKEAPILDNSGKGCITLALCGAGVKVMIDLDTRTRFLELELGLGAGYLRALQGKPGDSLDFRGALRSLPVISTQTTIVTNKFVRPYFTASFGLVDIWNGRAHNSIGKQAKIEASTFEYGLSGGIAIRPPHTNGQAVFEAGYRARNFASVGYGYTDPLDPNWPRTLDLSGWQLAAGWQFDLRPLAKAPDFSGSWTLSRVDGAPLPMVLNQARGDLNTREELMHGWLDLDAKPRTYRLTLVVRRSLVSASGVPQEVRYSPSIEERGSWQPMRGAGLTLTRSNPAAGTAESVSASQVEDELVLVHPITGHRMYFKRVR